jgi:hypothetical protein
MLNEKTTAGMLVHGLQLATAVSKAEERGRTLKCVFILE